MFNLNQSRKPEVQLNRNLAKELISMYGIPAKYLYAEKINKNNVFRDFSHLEIDKDVSFKEIYVLPEDANSWENDNIFNQFGLFNQSQQHLFIAEDTIIDLYPDFLEDSEGYSKLTNNLMIIPSGTVLEITEITPFTPGVNNLWAFADDTSVYKLSVKVYDNNIADKTDVNTDIHLQEGPEDEIFGYDEEVTNTDIDRFFEELAKDIDEIEELGDKGDDKGNNPSNTNSPFGSLS